MQQVYILPKTEKGIVIWLLKVTDLEYVVFSIDYRWINKLDRETQPTYMHQLIEDVFGAIAQIQDHAAQYGGDATSYPKQDALKKDQAVNSRYQGSGGCYKVHHKTE
jgi:hypothetical protein